MGLSAEVLKGLCDVSSLESIRLPQSGLFLLTKNKIMSLQAYRRISLRDKIEAEASIKSEAKKPKSKVEVSKPKKAKK